MLKYKITTWIKLLLKPTIEDNYLFQDGNVSEQPLYAVNGVQMIGGKSLNFPQPNNYFRITPKDRQIP